MPERIYDTSYTQNRELSWLKFNDRVLEEANDKSVPLIERLKFLAIVTSNLDEFFMIRVGSLSDMAQLKSKKTENKKNLTAKEQLDLIYKEVAKSQTKKDKTFIDIETELLAHDIKRLEFKDATKEEKKYLDTYYNNFIAPIISPQIIDPHHPFPHLENKALYIACILKHRKTKDLTYGIISIPEKTRRIISIPGDSIAYILVEDIILHNITKIYKQYQVQDKAVISVTRNADIAFDHAEMIDEDFSDSMKKLLKMRLLRFIT